jgi:hypothetical protein
LTFGIINVGIVIACKKDAQAWMGGADNGGKALSVGSVVCRYQRN